LVEGSKASRTEACAAFLGGSLEMIKGTEGAVGVQEAEECREKAFNKLQEKSKGKVPTTVALKLFIPRKTRFSA